MADSDAKKASNAHEMPADGNAEECHQCRKCLIKCNNRWTTDEQMPYQMEQPMEPMQQMPWQMQQPMQPMQQQCRNANATDATSHAVYWRSMRLDANL